MADTAYVVRGAKIKCNLGTHSSTLNALLSHGTMIRGKAVMTELDSMLGANIFPGAFRLCTIPKGPTPVTMPGENGAPVTGWP